MAAAATTMAWSFPMKRSRKILWRSTYIFLQDHHQFTFLSTLLALPFSVSLLLSLGFSLPPSTLLLPTVYNRLRSLFDAAGFPASSEFFKFLNLKLSQTTVMSMFTLPFSVTFLLFAKLCVITSLNHDGVKPVFPGSFSSFAMAYKSILGTYLCNSLIILSANATAFSLLFLAFNCLRGVYAGNNTTTGNSELLLSAAGAVLYSIILAHALVVCNLALILSGSEKIGGPAAIHKAWLVIRGSTSTSLSLAVLVNMTYAAVEALFLFRVVQSYQKNDLPRLTAAMESLLIAYLYSMLIVLDTIVGFIFYRGCKEMNLPTVYWKYTYQSQIEISSDHKCSCHQKQEIPQKLQLER